MATEEETREKLEGMTDNDLRTRHELGKVIVKQLRGDWADEDDAAEALDRYEAQLEAINAEIRRRRKKMREESGQQKPAPRKVKAKTAQIGRGH